MSTVARRRSAEASSKWHSAGTPDTVPTAVGTSRSSEAMGSATRSDADDDGGLIADERRARGRRRRDRSPGTCRTRVLPADAGSPPCGSASATRCSPARIPVAMSVDPASAASRRGEHGRQERSRRRRARRARRTAAPPRPGCSRRRRATRPGPARTSRARRIVARARRRRPRPRRRAPPGRAGRSRGRAGPARWRRSRPVPRWEVGPCRRSSGPGQAEHALAHDVALDVGRAAADRVGERLQVGPGPDALAVDGRQPQRIRRRSRRAPAGRRAGAARRGTAARSSPRGRGRRCGRCVRCR